MNLKRIDRLVKTVDVDRLTTTAQRVLRDPETRDAIARTYAQGRSVYEQLANEGAKKGFSKLARDPKRQSDVAALVRSVTETIDTQTRPARKRGRKFLTFLLGLAGAAAVVAHKRRSQSQQAPAAQGEPAAQGHPISTNNGATATDSVTAKA